MESFQSHQKFQESHIIWKSIKKHTEAETLSKETQTHYAFRGASSTLFMVNGVSINMAIKLF